MDVEEMLRDSEKAIAIAHEAILSSMVQLEKSTVDNEQSTRCVERTHKALNDSRRTLRREPPEVS